MNIKKLTLAVSFAALLPTTAFAHGELWYDAASHLPQFKKIVVYPIKGLDGQFKIDENEQSEIYIANDYFNKRFVRKLKMKTIPLGSLLKENKEIRTDEEKYQSLYNDFPSEKERAEAVASVTGADGYIITHINRADVEPHTSPSKVVNVQMKSWTEETGGPNGNRTYNERKWNVSHTIPEAKLLLYHMGIDYDIFDRVGNKIMVYRNFEHTYGGNYGGISGAISGLFGGKPTRSLTPERYRAEMFKNIVDEFRKDFKDIQNNFKENKKRERSTYTIGFKDIKMPDNVGTDEYSLKSIYFALKNLAYQHTKANVDYDGNGKAKYFVQGMINNYSLDRHWIEPHVTLYDKLLDKKEREWTDRNGNKHTMVVSQYETEIVDHHGYWQYTATVNGTLMLVDGNGKVLVSHNANETDDKTADAYRHLLKDFYKKVSAYLNGQ